MNKNVLSIKEQIENSLDVLLNLKLIKFFNPVKVDYDQGNDKTVISWYNHKGGREVSSNAFLKLSQYLTLLEHGAYHVLMNDYSIIRFSFTFEHNKLISQNLLWWPCPVFIDFEDDGEFSPYDIVNLHLEDQENLRMRSPIRVDFDFSNDTPDHPKAHVHTQHPKSRMNTIKPICFNTFIRFILNHYYPSVNISDDDFPSTPILVKSSKEISYNLKDQLFISQHF
ncbi:hypothetical protein QFZ25_000598 [Bacillus atrophaeus]|nr:DUF2290 domain-containing protein [Bacillus atrophaeus]MDQ0926538.1 hypothetical protein [Bacillus atrophaeus]